MMRTLILLTLTGCFADPGSPSGSTGGATSGTSGMATTGATSGDSSAVDTGEPTGSTADSGSTGGDTSTTTAGDTGTGSGSTGTGSTGSTGGTWGAEPYYQPCDACQPGEGCIAHLGGREVCSLIDCQVDEDCPPSAQGAQCRDVWADNPGPECSIPCQAPNGPCPQGMACTTQNATSFCIWDNP